MTRPSRKRLGRGLGALLGEDYLSSGGQEESGQIRTIATASIRANPFQPRREFAEEELADLQASIQENGLLQPLVVRSAPGRQNVYELVAGERRLRSITALGWTKVPAVVRDVDDRTLLVLALVENIQREELSPLEEAEGYRVLGEEFELTQAQIAEAVGRSRSAVANSLRLLRLPPSVRRMLSQGELSMGHARALLGIDDPARLSEMARRAAREGWSVREVEKRTRGKGASTGAPGPATPSSTRPDPVMNALQEELRGALGTRVALQASGDESGVIRIPFRNQEDFTRVFRILTGRDPRDVAG
ncbi:MAG: ParB/RepB/Spo0J family partition protein [Gemmatimonadales bacterium]|nr:MAG: ParB/RepB/Spo0J family partition protein [Gemmatimonadales bacterium]